MIEGRVDAVSTNDVDGQLLEEGDITFAIIGLGERVFKARRLSKGIIIAGNDKA